MPELKAGRELDALVAEKVMGWTKPRWVTCPSCGYDGLIGYDGYAPYSTEIIASWDVVKRMRFLGWKWLRLTTCDEHAIATFFKDGDFDRVQVQAGTPAEAICLAALKAVGVEVPCD